MWNDVKGCCDTFEIMDISKVGLPSPSLVDYNNFWVTLTALSIVLCPLVNNLIARMEYKTRFLTKLFQDHKRAARFFAAFSVLLAIQRDYSFYRMVRSQPQWPDLYENWILWLGFGLTYTGATLIYSAFKLVGFYAIFMGEYFGIFLDSQPCEFPYNLFSHPVYVGTLLSFIGVSMVFASQAGLFFCVLALVVFTVAGAVETAFTDDVYKAMSIAKSK